MTEELITFDTAKLAKEEQYPIYNNLAKTGFYNIRTGTYIHFGRTGQQTAIHLCAAPTQSLLQRWLREEHSVLLTVEYSLSDDDWFHYIYKNDVWGSKYVHSNTYEESLEKGLQEALKLINND